MSRQRTILLSMRGTGSRQGTEYTLFRLNGGADIYTVRTVGTSETGYRDISEPAFPSASEAVGYMSSEALSGKGGD